MKFAVYTANGQIQRIVTCPEPDIVDNLRPGEQFVACDDSVLDTTRYVQDGEFVEIPPSPSPYCYFDFGTLTWVDPRTTASQWDLIRGERNKLLSDCDWVVTKSVELGAATPTEWSVYRQALRDITLQADPFNITWPTPPQ